MKLPVVVYIPVCAPVFTPVNYLSISYTEITLLLYYMMHVLLKFSI